LRSNSQLVPLRRGAHHPILNAQERALGVLACRHVDEVIIGAPDVITRDLVATFNVAVVVAEAEEEEVGEEQVGDGNGKPGGRGDEGGVGGGGGDAAWEEGYREVRVSPVTGEVSEVPSPTSPSPISDGDGGPGDGGWDRGDGDRGRGDGDGRRDPNAVAKEMGIFRRVAVGDEPAAQLSTAAIIRRIAANRAAFEARNARKGASEAKYYDQKSSGAIELADES
jgi:hypothetical protein